MNKSDFRTLICPMLTDSVKWKVYPFKDDINNLDVAFDKSFFSTTPLRIV